jgi:hypothetical protein
MKLTKKGQPGQVQGSDVCFGEIKKIETVRHCVLLWVIHYTDTRTESNSHAIVVTY